MITQESPATSEKPYAAVHAAIAIALRMLEPEWKFSAWSAPEKPGEIAFYLVTRGQDSAIITVKT